MTIKRNFFTIKLNRVTLNVIMTLYFEKVGSYLFFMGKVNIQLLFIQKYI